ncbi:hypothetical protein ABGN05_24365 [Aquibium sp. LZ166]|uniref:Uncharacterized protein n=1 Tax=Aquibium pacificus TaxID=3153579 RepID=A0ABV3SPQ8_9HYPH
MDDIAILGGLFAVALIAAPIPPAQSEAALVELLVADPHLRVLLIAVANLGKYLLR